jgi:ribosomal protein S18 acetylase RimI-like enzyme
MDHGELEIKVPTGQEAARALRVVLAGCDSREAEALAGKYVRNAPRGAPDESGLFAAWRRDLLVAATWVQVLPGRVASFWPPRCAGGDNGEARGLLTVAAMEFADRQDTRFTQALVDACDPRDQALLQRCGFRELAELLFMACRRERFPQWRPEGPLDFVDVGEAQTPVARRLLGRTYEGSLDCPQIDGLRTPEEAIEGYRAQGDGSHWCIVRCASADVGCHFLADFPDNDQMELVYMGLAPEYRGRGWGRLIVEEALWRARAAGRSRMVLAVDRRNAPAVRMYEMAGFETWASRMAWYRLPHGRG